MRSDASRFLSRAVRYTQWSLQGREHEPGVKDRARQEDGAVVCLRHIPSFPPSLPPPLLALLAGHHWGGNPAVALFPGHLVDG